MLSPDTILTRAGMHTTGDFANLLTSTGNRVLLAAFQAAPNPLRSLARQTTISDFRTKTTVKLSEWPVTVGRKLAFDAASESVVNDPQAEKMLTRNYRAPFVVPEKV